MSAVSAHRAGRLFRSYIAEHLASLGLDSASARTTQARRLGKLSDAVADASDGERGDILGLDGWSVVTSFRRPLDVGDALDTARLAGKLDGNDKYAAIVHRPLADPSDSYVVTSLPVFAHLVREGA